MKKTMLALALLGVADVSPALDVALMAGRCDKASDYCPANIGKVVLGHSLIEKNGHAIRVEAEHISGITISDYGSNFFWVGYRYEFSK